MLDIADPVFVKKVKIWVQYPQEKRKISAKTFKIFKNLFFNEKVA